MNTKIKDFGRFRLVVKGTGDNATVKFFDLNTTFNKIDYPNGQFIQTYYARTLLTDEYGPSLLEMSEAGNSFCIDPCAKSWVIPADCLAEIYEFINESVDFEVV